MKEFILEFESLLDESTIEAEVEYEIVKDSDSVPYGEGMVDRNTSELEYKVKFTRNHVPYFPTKEEKYYWIKEIELELEIRT